MRAKSFDVDTAGDDDILAGRSYPSLEMLFCATLGQTFVKTEQTFLERETGGDFERARFDQVWTREGQIDHAVPGDVQPRIDSQNTRHGRGLSCSPRNG